MEALALVGPLAVGVVILGLVDLFKPATKVIRTLEGYVEVPA